MTTRITTSMVQRNILADLNRVAERLTRTQMKAASGREITKPSDDPYNAARAMAMRGDLESLRQFQGNIADAQAWQNTTEAALDSMNTSLLRARDLIVEGASDSSDPTSRAAIAAELEQIVESLKQDGNATYRGAYIFGGTATTAPPYAAGADDGYHGDQGGLDPAVPGIVRAIGPGVTMTINVVGDQVLGNGSGDGKLLSTLRGAIDHLHSGDGAALRGADLESIDRNLDTLLSARASNGARSNRLESALDRLAQVEEATTSQLSQVEDADIAKTLIDLSSQTAAYQAALRSGASIVQASLMDFLR